MVNPNVWVCQTDEARKKDIVVKEGTELYLKDSFFSHTEHSQLNITLEKKSKLFYLKHQAGSEETEHKTELTLFLEEDAHADIFFALNGAKICHIKTVCFLNGLRSSVNQDGFFLAFEKNTVHIENNIYHQNKHTVSSQTLHGLMSGYGKGTFKGKIVIPKGSSDSKAKQSHKNILLSNTARVISEPELEILEENVSCSHGSAIGHLSAEEIFYLRSRAIPEVQAKKILAQGFIEERIKTIPCKKTKNFIRSWALSLMDRSI